MIQLLPQTLSTLISTLLVVLLLQQLLMCLLQLLVAGCQCLMGSLHHLCLAHKHCQLLLELLLCLLFISELLFQLPDAMLQGLAVSL
jgi:hypothetical protein